MHHTSKNYVLKELLSQLFSLLNYLQLTLACLVIVVIQISWPFLYHKLEHFKRSIAANDFVE